MKKSFTIILLALVASLATAQSTQRSEDLKSIPGTWWFMAKLDNPVDTLLLIKSDAQPPMKVKTLTKNEHGMFLFYTPLTEPCNFLIFTPPSDDMDNFFDFNVHAEPGEVLSVQGCYDVNKPAYGLTFGGSRYYVDYAEAFMRLNNPPKEEEEEGDIIDSVLIVVNGKELPKSMNRQLINPYRCITKVGGKPPLSFIEQMKNQHEYYDLELMRDLRAYFLRHDEHVKDFRVLSDTAATAIYGSIGACGAIEVTTRPFLSVAPLSPSESKARRLASLINIYDTYYQGHVVSVAHTFRPDGFIYNGENNALDPDLFATPVEEQFFGQLTNQHGHMTSEYFGPVDSDSRGIYVPLIREVEIMLPTNVDQNHVDSVVNAIRQAAKQADKSIERTDSLVRLAFIFGGKVKEGKPHPFRTFPMRENGSSDIESRYYFTPDAKAESSWWAEAYFRTTHPKKLVMHLVSVDKLYASSRPVILEKRRHMEGTVVDDESGKPVADALVYSGTTMGLSDAGGIRTDKKGRFDFWLPFQNEAVRVSKSGYKDAIWIQPADTALTVRLIPASSPKQQPIPLKTVTTTGNGVKAGDKISGTLSDEAGPLFGGTVCEIDANGRIVESAITDMNGAFRIEVRNPEDHIRFSYVGMKTTTVPIDRKEYNIKMKPVESQYDYKMLRRQSGRSTLPIPQREMKNVTIINEDLKGFTVTTDKGVSNENNPRITIPMSDKEQALVMSVNDLGFNMFRKLGTKNNILLSPMGMTYALGLISNGAGGETKKQINMVLGCDDTKAANINDFCRKMLTKVQKLDRLTQMEISNDFFSQKGYTPKSAFAKIANDDYHTALKTLEPDIDKGFILMNTINFKGIWKDKFNGLIEDVVFKDEDGKETKVPMMNQKHQFFYTENDLCQAICLPYGNGAYQMIVLLPKGGKKVSEVAQWLTADKWEKMYDQMRRVDVDVKLPRFEFSSDVELTDVMKALGMPNALSIKKANFSNLFDMPSYIDKIKQKGHIKVDETGTAAKVITLLEGDLGGRPITPPDIIRFHATHPFLYFIREWSTSAIFFIGQYMGI